MITGALFWAGKLSFKIVLGKIQHISRRSPATPEARDERVITAGTYDDAVCIGLFSTDARVKRFIHVKIIYCLYLCSSFRPFPAHKFHLHRILT